MSCAVLGVSTRVYAADGPDCHVGSYRLADGRLIDIAPSEGAMLRWRGFDGATGALHEAAGGSWKSTFGWTDRADGLMVSFAACGAGRILFGGVAGEQIRFDVREARFQSHGTALVGRLLMPKGKGRVPIVVLLHGSEQDSG